MGQEFCSACENNCLSNIEGDFSNKYNKQNKPEENILFKNNEYMENKTNFSIYFTQNKINNAKVTDLNDDNSSYINKISRPYIFNESVDKNKLFDIILKYKINLLIKYFRKFKRLKKNLLKKVVIENYLFNQSNAFNSNSNYYNNNSSIMSYQNNFNNKNNTNNNNKEEINLSPKKDYIFIGHKFNDKKEGYGLEIYSDINARYFGGFKNGKKHGYCRFSVYNIEQSYYYFGEVFNDKVNGFGYFENCKNGTKYEGDWKESLRDGYGIESYDDGAFYRGQFCNGSKNGIGIYKWVDKSSYEGEWLNNFIHGYGKYIFSDNSIYIGHWKYNKMDGFGEFSYPSKKTYFGFFKDNIKNGFGILFSSIEKKAFIGFWGENKQNGLGQFIKDNKFIYGQWENGKLKKKIENKELFFNNLSKNEKKYQNNFTTKNFQDFHKKISQIKLDF